MNRLIYVILAVLVAFVGCLMCDRLLPPGAPRTIGEVLSVVAGFCVMGGGWGFGTRA